MTTPQEQNSAELINDSDIFERKLDPDVIANISEEVYNTPPNPGLSTPLNSNSNSQSEPSI